MASKKTEHALKSSKSYLDITFWIMEEKWLQNWRPRHTKQELEMHFIRNQ